MTLLKNKTRKCPKCQKDILYQSPSAKNRAELKKSICIDCYSNQIPKLLSSFQKEIMNGLLLGDGCVQKSGKKSKNCRFTICRQIKDKNYMFWHYDIFKKFYGTEPKYYANFDKRTNRTYKGYACITKSGNVFTELKSKWYDENNKKIVPKDLIITPYTLLVWFLDDGCIVKKSNKCLIIKLSTDGFIRNDVEFLQKSLKNTFDIDLNIYKNGSGFVLKGSTQQVLKIIKIIDPILPKCMDRKRKWIDEDGKNLEILKNYLNSH